MENTKLKIEGMHCESCKSLIRMELEELGLDKKIKTITIGEIELVGATQAELEIIKQAINNLEGYKAI